MERRGLMNRKGDVTITTVILIVLGLAVLVFLVIGLTQGWDVFFGTIGTVDPGDLQVFAKACVGYAEAELGISFCDFKKIDAGGDDEWINCKDSRLDSELASLSVSEPTCSGSNTAVGFCKSGNKIQPNKYDTIKVNGNACSSSDNGGLKTACTVDSAAEYKCECNNKDICDAGQVCNADGTCGTTATTTLNPCTPDDGTTAVTNPRCQCGSGTAVADQCDTGKKCDASKNSGSRCI
jgi:hypothetical protein